MVAVPRAMLRAVCAAGSLQMARCARNPAQVWAAAGWGSGDVCRVSPGPAPPHTAPTSSSPTVIPTSCHRATDQSTTHNPQSEEMLTSKPACYPGLAAGRGLRCTGSTARGCWCPGPSTSPPRPSPARRNSSWNLRRPCTVTQY